MYKHTYFRHKMKVFQICRNHPYLSHFVPETHWFSRKNVEKMVRKHSVVYLKPNKGLQGQGVIRIKRLSQYQYEIASGSKRSILSRKAMIKRVSDMVRKYPDYYLVQQGVHLATYRKRPFDIRVLLIKYRGRWRFTMTAVRAAAFKNATVTNVSHNVKWLPQNELQFSLNEVLRGNDQHLNPFSTLRELIDLSYQVVHTLGKRFPVSILGLDFILDRSGRLWFIEANTNPEVEALREINPERYYQLFVHASKQIKIMR